MKGFTVVNMVAHIRDVYGQPALDQFYAELPATLAEPLKNNTVVSVAWVPLEMYYAGVQFLVKHFHGGSPLGARKVGHALASKDLGTIYKAVLRFTSPATVVSLSGRFWNDYFDRGKLQAQKLEKNRVAGTLSQWPFTDEITANEIAGSLLAWLEHSNARKVRMVEMAPTGPDTLQFDIAFE
jgi:hypothetical protein